MDMKYIIIGQFSPLNRRTVPETIAIHFSWLSSFPLEHENCWNYCSVGHEPESEHPLIQSIAIMQQTDYSFPFYGLY